MANIVAPTTPTTTMRSTGFDPSKCINLSGVNGTGELTTFPEEVVGYLLGIEPRFGTYNFTVNGESREGSESWNAWFRTTDGRVVCWAWPTYINKTTGEIEMWRGFDTSIDLGRCQAEGILLHVKKEKRPNGLKVSTLEVVQQPVQPQPQPMAQPQQAMQPMVQQPMAQPQPMAAPQPQPVMTQPQPVAAQPLTFGQDMPWS